LLRNQVDRLYARLASTVDPRLDINSIVVLATNMSLSTSVNNVLSPTRLSVGQSTAYDSFVDSIFLTNNCTHIIEIALDTVLDIMLKKQQ
jgi:hypothetical protein